MERCTITLVRDSDTGRWRLESSLGSERFDVAGLATHVAEGQASPAFRPVCDCRDFSREVDELELDRARVWERLNAIERSVEADREKVKVRLDQHLAMSQSMAEIVKRHASDQELQATMIRLLGGEAAVQRITAGLAALERLRQALGTGES